MEYGKKKELRVGSQVREEKKAVISEACRERGKWHSEERVDDFEKMRGNRERGRKRRIRIGKKIRG